MINVRRFLNQTSILAVNVNKVSTLNVSNDCKTRKLHAHTTILMNQRENFIAVVVMRLSVANNRNMINQLILTYSQSN